MKKVQLFLISLFSLTLINCEDPDQDTKDLLNNLYGTWKVETVNVTSNNKTVEYWQDFAKTYPCLNDVRFVFNNDGSFKVVDPSKDGCRDSSKNILYLMPQNATFKIIMESLFIEDITGKNTASGLLSYSNGKMTLKATLTQYLGTFEFVLTK